VKRDAWEGGHRVPFIVRWPGRVKAGTTSDQIASLTDVLATAAAITGAELPRDAAEDSFSLLPALEGKATAPIRPYLLTQAFGGERTLTIRRGNWKLINHRGSGGNNYDKSEMKRPAGHRPRSPRPTLRPRHGPRRADEPLLAETGAREGTQGLARSIQSHRPQSALN
jgi:arylsulfatase A-like enzyme